MDLKLPPLGEGADSGTVVNLFVSEGDQVKRDQPILELENEKAVAAIPATASGTVTRIYVKVGDKISVGQSLVALSEGGATGTAPAAKSEAPAAKAKAPAAEPAHEAPADSEPGELKPSKIEPAAAPSLRKLARDLGIDLTLVTGTARGGRIVLEDLRTYIQKLQRWAKQPRAVAQAAAQGKAPAEQIDFSKWGPVTKAPLTPLRQVIARRMLESWSSTPRVTQFDEADLTNVTALRKKYAAAYEAKGTRLTLTPFTLKAVVETLKKHAILNASVDEVAEEIVFKNYYHLGIAVDTDAGLIVPVIRDADKKSLLQLSQELEELAKKARERRVGAEELKGGTFTISNQGGIGGGHFTPIINKPQVAILGLGRGAMKAVVRDNAVVARMMLPVALAYDHRLIDGGTAARFTVDFVQALENFREEDVKL
jgi:pyruvate dehydrogenase E2 component (dihydrolipoamide acetyltransferase)